MLCTVYIYIYISTYCLNHILMFYVCVCVFYTVADLGFFKGRGHSGATIYRGGPSIMQFFLDYFVTWH